MNPQELIPRSEADRLVREAVESERKRILKLVGNWTGCKYCSTGETFTEILNPPKDGAEK